MRHQARMSMPVLVEVPAAMRGAVEDVLSGEYECGLFGEGLEIVDIGANVGSFAIWASARWPGSNVTAYEPHPGTFAMLERNVASYENVRTVNKAVYPTTTSHVSFHARFDGDGEGGVAECMEHTFLRVAEERCFEVPVIHPAQISAGDVLKIDVEGSEADILHHLDLSSTSVILIEFQNDKNRAAIRTLLQSDFDVIVEHEFPWDELLPGEYRPDLAGDHFGHLFFRARCRCKLRAYPPIRQPHRSWRAIASEIYRKAFRG